MLSYGRLTINFRTNVFTHTRWLFSYGATFLPDARGNIRKTDCEIFALQRDSGTYFEHSLSATEVFAEASELIFCLVNQSQHL